MGTKKAQTGVDYKAIVETVPAIVFVAATSPNGVWYYVNEWIEPILGFSVEEWTGDENLWSRQLHPEDRQAALDEAVEVINAEAAMAAGDEYHSGTFYLDYRMLHKDGHVVWIRDSSVLVRAPDGTLLWHGIMLDITDQKLIEQQLERQSGAQETVARLGELALGGMPITELLQEACRMTTKVLGVDAAAASQVGEDGQSLDVRADYGWPAPETRPDHHGIDPRSPGAQALMTGKPWPVRTWMPRPEVTPVLLTSAGIKEHHLGAVSAKNPSHPLGCVRCLLP